MNSKNHRHNHDFQILYFLVGKCHTPDGAYSLLCDLKEDRQIALNNLKPTKLRHEAKMHKAKWKLWSPFKIHRLQAQADIEEEKVFQESSEASVVAAQDELAFIEECIKRISPYRKYSHLPDKDAHEAAQQEEWKLELMTRAKNYLLTQGAIPTDHFEAMSLHPEFKTTILPAIEQTRFLLSSPEGYKQIVNSLGKGPLLLENKENDIQCSLPEVRPEIQELSTIQGTTDTTSGV